MSALNAHILYLLFDSANMHRWNDHLRPVDLTEMDKQAHKAAISWVLGKFDDESSKKVQEASENACECIKLIVQGKTDEAMNKYNS